MPFRKTVPAPAGIDEQGITLITRRCLEMGFLFQPQPAGGCIDGHIELVDPRSRAFPNLTLPVHSMASNRLFPAETKNEFRYVVHDGRDLRRWLEGDVPVILVLSHPEQDEAWWVDLTSAFQAGSGRLPRIIAVDKRTQRFDRDAAPALRRLAAAVEPVQPAGRPPLPRLAGAGGVMCPWPGLAAYTRDEADLFFGRESLVRELAHRVSSGFQTGGGPLAVVGASGAGKSSLLHAGLIPAMTRNIDGTAAPTHTPTPTPVQVITLTPGRNPLCTLAGHLAACAGRSVAAAQVTPPTDPAELPEPDRRNPPTEAVDTSTCASAGAGASVNASTDAGACTGTGTGTDTGSSIGLGADSGTGVGSGMRCLLIVDQFEELFTLCNDESERQAFVHALWSLGWSAAAGAGSGGLKPPVVGPAHNMSVVLAVRTDFYGQCMAYPELARMLAHNQLVVGPMGAGELRAAIEKPAEAMGSALDHGLTELIVRDLCENNPIPSPTLSLLSHAMRETWLHSGGRKLLTLADYRAAGRIDGAVAGKAEATYAALEPDAQDAARRILLRLAVMHADTHATRSRVRRSELTDGMSAADARALTALIAARLVIFGDDTTEDDTVEIVHEALLRKWPRLREWLDDNRAWLHTRDQLVADAGEWERGGREQSRLYRGLRLAVTRDRLAAAPVDDIGSPARAFLDASTVHGNRAVSACTDTDTR